MKRTDGPSHIIAPAAIRYIKLGPGGAWEAASLDGGRIDWGDNTDPHALALAGDWGGARQAYLDLGLLPATATSHLRELADSEVKPVGIPI